LANTVNICEKVTGYRGHPQVGAITGGVE